MKRFFALFAAAAASMALGSCKHAPPAGVAAEVNGQPITYDKLEKTYRTQYPQVPENANEDLVQSQKLIFRNCNTLWGYDLELKWRNQ